MTEFLFNLLYTTPVLAALLLVASFNTRRERRVRQSLVPVLSVIYMVPMLVLLYRFNDAIRNALTWVSEYFPTDITQRLLAQLYVLENLLLILVFAIVKVATKPLLELLFREGSNVGQSLVARVYEYDREYDLWFIDRRFGNLRAFFRIFYWGSAVLAILFMALARMFSDWPGFSSAAYPAAAALIIGEVYFALDGRTRDEYNRDIIGEKDNARRVANFGPLRGVLREMFPERVLADGIQLSSRDPLDSGFRVGELSRSDDPGERLAGTYFDRLKRARHDVDVNLVDASVELLRGNSVLFNNPFYSDLTPYIAVPAYLNLLRYQKILVVSGRDSLADDLVDWMRDGLESITGVPGLWAVERVTGFGQDLDVGVIRFADVHNLELLRENDEFLQQVGLVVMVEPARMMATGQLGLSLLFSRCARGRMPTYVAMDGNHDGLVDALSHLVKVSLTEVVASTLPRGANSEVIWKADGPQKHAGIFPALSRYLGLGTDIGAVALKYQVKRVHWVGSETFPVTDMMWIAGQYYGAINSFADLELSQDALDTALVAVANPWKMEQGDNYFLIVEDEAANIYETVRRFSTRATHVGFVNVLSGDYLLRDYMIDNRDLFAADPKAIPAVVPDFARTERNVTLRLLLALVTFQVPEEDLIREFEIAGMPLTRDAEVNGTDPGSEPLLVGDLRRALLAHTDINQVQIHVSKYAVGTSGQTARSYSVKRDADIDEAISHLRPAYFLVEDDREEVSRIGSLLYGHVYQSLLPGQFVTYGGKYYEVQSIIETSQRSGVILRRAADHIRDRRVYRQLREYRLEGLRQSETTAAHLTVGETEIIRAVATVTAKSNGYIESLSRSDLLQGKRILISGLPERTYVNKAVLVIRFPGIEPSVRKTISLLLNELFVTVFPHSHEYIAAITPDPDRLFGDLLHGIEITDPILFREDHQDLIVIVEDSMIDMGLVVAVERQWDRLLEMITDYLAWNASPVPEEPSPTEFVPQFPDRPERVVTETRWQRILRRLGLRRARTTLIPQPAAPVADGEPDASVPLSDPASEESPIAQPEVRDEATDGDADSVPTQVQRDRPEENEIDVAMDGSEEGDSSVVSQ
jgi:hypothetical protein